MKLPKLAIQKISQFDPITKFRLKNAFMVAVGISLLGPVVIALKGSLLPVWVISILGIITTLAIYTNERISKLRLDTLYKLGIGVHLLLIVSVLLYFWNPSVMIILESIIGIVEVAVFSAYTINLNDYISKYYPRSMKKFQVIRNASWADASLIGLGIATIMGLCCSIEWTIILFIIYNTLFSIYMVTNWNFYKNPNFKGYKEMRK
jgi:hypothetical protein